jgi:trk system potassium uptake protein TrkA
VARQILVLGLGRFGGSVAVELERRGYEVLAVDRDAQAVQQVAGQVTHAVAADVTNENTLRELGPRDFEAAVIGMGVDALSSVLTTVLLKRLGMKYVLSKADNALHADILQMVGADRVVLPELEAGLRVAHSLHMADALDYFDVGPGFGVVRLLVGDQAGSTLGEIGLTGRPELMPIFLKRGDRVIPQPGPEERLRAGDELTIAGSDAALTQIRV